MKVIEKVMDISVIVPVYNASSTIFSCVESLVNQSYRDIEIILINDGSIDDSLSKCCELAVLDDRIKVIDKENGGASSARNVGIIESKGRWVCFVDSDDFVNEHYIENLMCGDIDFVVSGLCLKKRDNWITVKPKESFAKTRESLIDFIYLLDSTGYVFNGPYQKRFSNAILKENNLLFKEDIDYGEDTLFVLNYMQYISSAMSINTADYYYVLGNENSLSTTITFERRFSYLVSLELELGKFVDLFQPSKSQLNILLYFFTKQVYATILLCYANRVSFLTRKQNISYIQDVLKRSKWYVFRLKRFVNWPMFVTSKYGLNMILDLLNRIYFFMKKQKNK